MYSPLSLQVRWYLCAVQMLQVPYIYLPDLGELKFDIWIKHSRE